MPEKFENKEEVHTFVETDITFDDFISALEESGECMDIGFSTTQKNIDELLNLIDNSPFLMQMIILATSKLIETERVQIMDMTDDEMLKYVKDKVKKNGKELKHGVQKG